MSDWRSHPEIRRKLIGAALEIALVDNSPTMSEQAKDEATAMVGSVFGELHIQGDDPEVVFGELLQTSLVASLMVATVLVDLARDYGADPTALLRQAQEQLRDV